jgi:hypothetical protein
LGWSASSWDRVVRPGTGWRRAGYGRKVATAPEPLATSAVDDGVDVTLIRWMLSLTPEERLAVLQGFVDSALELAVAGPASHAAPATEILRRTLEEGRKAGSSTATVGGARRAAHEAPVAASTLSQRPRAPRGARSSSGPFSGRAPRRGCDGPRRRRT